MTSRGQCPRGGVLVKNPVSAPGPPPFQKSWIRACISPPIYLSIHPTIHPSINSASQPKKSLTKCPIANMLPRPFIETVCYRPYYTKVEVTFTLTSSLFLETFSIYRKREAQLFVELMQRRHLKACLEIRVERASDFTSLFPCDPLPPLDTDYSKRTVTWRLVLSLGGVHVQTQRSLRGIPFVNSACVGPGTK